MTKNKLLEEQAAQISLEDPLTGLYNRRGLDVYAEEEFSRAKRNQSYIGVVIIDLDYFKFYNDCYGHEAGDLCLVDIARIIKKHARRPGDIVARIGGDEFVMILGQTNRKQAYSLAKAIKDDFFNMKFTLPNKGQVTMSAGITALIPDKDLGYKEALYKKADTALYIAKKQKNSVFIIDGKNEPIHSTNTESRGQLTPE